MNLNGNPRNQLSGKSLAGFTDEYAYNVVINNELRFDGNYDGKNFEIYEDTTTNPERLNFDYNNNNLMYLDTTGTVFNGDTTFLGDVNFNNFEALIGISSPNIAVDNIYNFNNNNINLYSDLLITGNFQVADSNTLFRKTDNDVVIQWVSNGANLQILSPTLNDVRLLNSSGGHISLADITGDVLFVNSGNIGIATTNPTQKLQVSGNLYINQDDSAFVIDGASNGRLGFIKRSGFAPTVASSSGNDIIFSNSNQSNILNNISTSTLTELMRLTSDGKLGIGRTPTTYLLELEDTTNASIFFKNSNNSLGALVGLDSGGDLLLSQGNSTDDTRMVHNGSDRLVINNSHTYFLNSNVGFGLTTPNTARIVIGNNDFNDSDGILYFNHDSPWGFFQGGNGTSASLDLKTLSDNKKFRILNANNSVVSETTAAISGSTFYYNGNVGIGKTPSQVLDVSGNINADGNILGDGITINNSTLEFRTQATSIVGQWFSPGGNLQLKNPSSGNIEMLNSAGGYLSLADSTGDVLYVKSGKVGIGTISPSYKLQVYGYSDFDTRSTSATTIDMTIRNQSTAIPNYYLGCYAAFGEEGGLYTNGSGNFATYSISDKKFKKNIIPYNKPYNKIKKLRTVEFEWNTDIVNKNKGKVIGFIAQEVEKAGLKCINSKCLKKKKIKKKIKKIIKDINDNEKEIEEIIDVEIDDENSRSLIFSQTELIPFLWSAVRQLISDKEDLENKYNNLLLRIEDLENIIDLGITGNKLKPDKN